MAVTKTVKWDDTGTVIPVGQAKYAVSKQPIAEYDNWFNNAIVVDIQAVIDDVIDKYNANTILKADTDNDPIALTVGVDTLVGRKTGGVIAALTPAEVCTMLDVQSGADIPIFEEDINVVRERLAGGYNNDFIVGSPQLNDDTISAHDTRMFFDKGLAAFRSGSASSTEWNNSNLGIYSFGAGSDVVASGTCAISLGCNNVSSGGSALSCGSQCNATGNCSIAGGESSISSGDHSISLGRWTNSGGNCSLSTGYYTEALSNYSSAFGSNSISYLIASHALSSGYFTAEGDSQQLSVVTRRETTDAVETELTIDGASPSAANRLILPANRTWAFSVIVSVRKTNGTSIGDSGAYKLEGVIKRDGSNNTQIVGSPMVTTIATDVSAWNVTAAADNVNECLVIKVTGQSSTTIHWTARVELIEVG